MINSLFQLVSLHALAVKKATSMKVKVTELISGMAKNKINVTGPAKIGHVGT